MSATADPAPATRPAKSPAAFRTISEVAAELDVPQHVLRFWETKFAQVRPLKRGGGRRYYRPEDIQLLRRIRQLLYADGYTIKGVQKLLREGMSRPAARVADPPDAAAKPEAARPVPTRTDAPPAAADAAMRAELRAVLAELESLRALIVEG